MFKARVVEDLSYAPRRLKEADEIAEHHLRRFIKNLITERHAPRRSDLRPLGEFIGQTLKGFLAAKRGDVEEANRSAEAINLLSSDFYYQQRNLLNEALDIAEKITINSLFDFYDVIKTSDLATILPGWKRLGKPKVIKIRRVKVKKKTRISRIRARV